MTRAVLPARRSADHGADRRRGRGWFPGGALTRISAARVSAGRGPIAVRPFPQVGHNLMRYRPDEVTAAILGVSAEGGR